MTPDVAIVITTYNRRALLRELLESIRSMTMQPSAVFLIDNESHPDTEAMAREFNIEYYVAMYENTGGAGGFSRGVELAYKAGYEWIWIMDDDVAVLPDGLEKLSKWLERSDELYRAGKNLDEVESVFQTFKYNWDGSFFYWQYRFFNKLWIPNPLAPSKFGEDEKAREMNTMCFEGGVVNRRVIEKIGYPDFRYFIYWDDTLYGYLASKVTKMLLVRDYCLRRTREIENVKIGRARKLNSTSNMSRYHIMKNRGHMAHYLMEQGDYNPMIFAMGTFLTFWKEFIRLFVSKEFKTGLPFLIKGMREARAIRREKHWKSYQYIHPISPVAS
jgi:rhamnopyranosyl-N-acetylglucosaminyl-diphospho-decaprenol beta-1,3/1,4-galactofuranosyltransferase